MATDPLAAALAAYDAPQDPLQAALAAYNQPEPVQGLEEDDGYGLSGLLKDVASVPALFGSRMLGGMSGVGEALAGAFGSEFHEKKYSTIQDTLAAQRQEYLGEGTRGALHPVELGANLLNIPMIALTGVGGLTAMGAQAAGSEYHEARKEGASRGSAALSGVLSGASEFAFSRLVGDAKVVEKIAGMGLKGMGPKEALKFLNDTGRREAADELLTFLSQRAGQELTYKDTEFTLENIKKDVKGAFESAAGGYLIGGVAPVPKFLRGQRDADSGIAETEPGPVTGPGIAPDDALAQVRELQNQAMGAKLAQEQQTFEAIMRPLSQDDADAMSEYEILEQEEGRLKGQIGAVKEQESGATKLYEELKDEGKWGLSQATIDKITRKRSEGPESNQDKKALLIADMIRSGEPDEDQLAGFAERVKTLAPENPAVAEAVSDMIVNDGVTKETVHAVEALAIKGADTLLGEEAAKTRFLSKDAEAEQLAAMSEAVADSAIKQLGGNVTAESIRADTEFAELAGMNLLQAQEALAQMRQAQHEADMLLSGDPSRLDSPQAFAAQRVELENQLQDLYARREALKATMAESRQEALSRMESGVEAESAVERLRAKALEISGKSGDFGYFDQFDIEARRMGRNPAVALFVPPTDHRPRSLAEAASEYRDAMYAVLPRMEKRLNAKYDEMRKDNKIPRNEIGELMTREEFVLQETNTAIQAANAKLQELLRLNAGKPGGEDVRALDAEMLSMLKRYRVKPGDVGFRGDLAMMRQGIADAGAEWLGERIPAGKVFSELEAGELVGLAQEARTAGSPMSVFQFIEGELARRAANLPPKDLDPAKMAPDELNKRVKNRLESDIPNQLLEDLRHVRTHDVPPKNSWLLNMVYKSRQVGQRIRSQFKEGFQIGEGRATYFYGPSITDPIAQWTSPGKRKAAEGLLKNAFLAKDAVKNEITHKFATLLSDLDGAVEAFAAQQAAQGTIMHSEHADMLWRAIQEKYESGRTSELPDPIRQIVQKKIMPELDALSELAAQYAPSEKIAAAIKANKGRWLFRHYGIFSEKDAVSKRLAESSEAWKSLESEFRAGNFSRYKEAALNEARRAFGRTKSESELISMAEGVAESRIKGDIYSIIRSHLRPQEQARMASMAVPTARQENMISRVLEDPRIQELMGRETNFKLSVQHSIENLATDFAAIKLRNDIHAVFRAAGQISDVENDVANVPVNPKTYERYTGEDPGNVAKPIYMSPEVYNFFNAVGKQADAWNVFANRAISFIKLGALLNPGTFLQNLFSAPQMFITAYGLSTHGTGLVGGVKTSAELVRLAHSVVKELEQPGSRGRGVFKVSDATAKAFFLNVGNTPLDTVRAEVDEAIRFMVDAGGEFSFDLEEAQHALFEGAEKRQPGTVRQGQKGLAKAVRKSSDLYKYPDVMVKWLAYKHNVQRLTWLAGLDAPTDAIKREAADYTLKTTQDPRTTIPLVRNLSRGKIGLLTFGFAGFTYQMGRNLWNAGKSSIDSAIMAKGLRQRAARLEAAGNVAEASSLRAQAGRYASDATERALSTTIAAYLYSHVTQKFGSELLQLAFDRGEEEDATIRESIKAASFPESRQQEIVVSKIEKRRVASKAEPDNKVERRFVTIINSGNMNLYDNVFKALRAFATPGIEPEERVLAAAKELQYIYLSPSMFTEFAMELAGAGIKNDPSSPMWTWWKRPAHQASPTARIGRAAENVAPRIAQSPYQIITGMSGDEEMDPNDPRSEKWRHRMWKQLSGMGSYTIDLDSSLAQRFADDYRGAASWTHGMREEWKKARSFDAKMAVKAKYAPKVENLMKKFSRSRDIAIGTGLKPYQLEAMLKDRREYGVAIPKSVASSIAYGFTARIDDFLPKE